MALYTGIALTAASIGSSVYSANQQSKAAKSASKAQQRSADAGVAEQQRQFDTALELQAPQRAVGNSATNALARMLGLPQFNEQQFTTQSNFSKGLDPQGRPLTSIVGNAELPIEGRTFADLGNGYYDVRYGDKSVGQLQPGGPNGKFVSNGEAIPELQIQSVPGTMVEDKTSQFPTGTPGGANPMAPGDPNADFLASPDYAFRRGEGTRDIAQSYAARGSGRSGNALRALAEFNSGLASQEYGQRFNRLASLAGFGQVANSQGAQAALATGRGVAAGLQDAGNARASGVIGSANARAAGLDNALGTVAGFAPLIQDAYQQRQLARDPGNQRAYSGGLTRNQIATIFAPR